ncbi:MAG TPA: pyrroloquinoline quinone biosynthesis protein PqqB [Polyangia bacterium]|nr:pyrroloquinoline quinone biosynthesis protein PqqB [Polyangia bacterium]
MRVHVLGSAAGGGFPQWNCGCANCHEVRRGSDRTEARTQDSIALRGDGDDLVLVNASPDILQQIQRTPALAPRRPRHSPISAIVLTNGDMDHILGLFSLRESYPLHIYATAPVWHGLSERNVMFRTLQRFDGHVTWHQLTLETPATLPNGVTLTPFAVPGKLPVHLERDSQPSLADNIGLEFTQHDKRVVYCAAAGTIDAYCERFDGANCLLFDGTFWSSDELVRQGLSQARAESMAHLPIGGDHGSLTRLAHLATDRKIFTHINNSNPVLLRDSAERAEVERRGWEIAFDGMEIDV